jgi:hypothetical protein
MEGPLLTQQSEWLQEDDAPTPLQAMSTAERLVSDYAGTGLTVGKHPMFYRRGNCGARASSLRRICGAVPMEVSCALLVA